MKTERAAKKRRRRSPARGVLDLHRALETALREKFPTDTVDISDGYKDNVHVLVVSRRFDGLSEYARQGMLRDIIESIGLSRAQKAKISLLMALSPAELK